MGLKLEYGTYNKEEPYQVSSRRDQGIVSIERCVKEFSESFGRTAIADKKIRRTMVEVYQEDIETMNVSIKIKVIYVKLWTN